MLQKLSFDVVITFFSQCCSNLSFSFFFVLSQVNLVVALPFPNVATMKGDLIEMFHFHVDFYDIAVGSL